MTATRKHNGIAPDGYLKSGLKLIGAKTGSTKVSGRSIIYQMLPKDADAYIEPFAGSGAIFIGREPAAYEWINDINPYAINFFQVLQAQPEAFWDRLQSMTARVEAVKLEPKERQSAFFREVRDWQPACAEIHGAIWFYFIAKYSMNGIIRFNKSGFCNSSWCQTFKGRGIFDREWFDAVVERIRYTRFTQMDFGRMLLSIPKELQPKAIAVLDPPYQGVFTEYDRIKFSDADHEQLATILQNTHFRWLLTINDTPMVRNLYKGMNMKEVEIHYSCSNTAKGRGKKPELFITNYD